MMFFFIVCKAPFFDIRGFYIVFNILYQWNVKGFLIGCLQSYNITQSYKTFILVLTAFQCIMVQWYHLYIKALLYAMFKGFKAVVWCVVWQRVKIITRSVDAVTLYCWQQRLQGCCGSVGSWLGQRIGRGVGKGRELPHGLYPDKNHSFLIPF